jgi:hypothetical protein
MLLRIIRVFRPKREEGRERSNFKIRNFTICTRDQFEDDELGQHVGRIGEKINPFRGLMGKSERKF